MPIYLKPPKCNNTRFLYQKLQHQERQINLNRFTIEHKIFTSHPNNWFNKLWREVEYQEWIITITDSYEGLLCHSFPSRKNPPNCYTRFFLLYRKLQHQGKQINFNRFMMDLKIFASCPNRFNKVWQEVEIQDQIKNITDSYEVFVCHSCPST